MPSWLRPAGFRPSLRPPVATVSAEVLWLGPILDLDQGLQLPSSVRADRGQPGGHHSPAASLCTRLAALSTDWFAGRKTGVRYSRRDLGRGFTSATKGATSLGKCAAGG
jgi:hypothetical protein